MNQRLPYLLILLSGFFLFGAPGTKGGEIENNLSEFCSNQIPTIMHECRELNGAGRDNCRKIYLIGKCSEKEYLNSNKEACTKKMQNQLGCLLSFNEKTVQACFEKRLPGKCQKQYKARNEEKKRANNCYKVKSECNTKFGARGYQKCLNENKELLTRYCALSRKAFASLPKVGDRDKNNWKIQYKKLSEKNDELIAIKAWHLAVVNGDLNKFRSLLPEDSHLLTDNYRLTNKFQDTIEYSSPLVIYVGKRQLTDSGDIEYPVTGCTYDIGLGQEVRIIFNLTLRKQNGLYKVLPSYATKYAHPRMRDSCPDDVLRATNKKRDSIEYTVRDTIATIAGPITLQIGTYGNRYRLVLGKKSIIENEMPIYMKDSLPVNGPKKYLLVLVDGNRECPGIFSVIELDKSGVFRRTKNFQACNGIKKFYSDGASIRIEIYSQDRSNKSSTLNYRDGRIY